MLILPPAVPCKNHGPGSACTLDLRALAARSFECFQARVALRRELDGLAEVLDGRVEGDRALYYARRRELRTLDAEQRLLYATRAHHRGKVAELAAKRYQQHGLGSTPGMPITQTAAQTARDPLASLRGHESYPAFVARMLPFQAHEVKETWMRFSVTSEQAGVLLHIALTRATEEELYEKALAAGITRGTVTGLLRALIDKGRLERRDGATTQLPYSFYVTTDKGREFLGGQKAVQPTT